MPSSARKPSLGGRWLRREAEQTDEGRGAAAILLKPQSDLPVLPGPHQSRLRRSSFPQGRPFGAYKPRTPRKKVQIIQIFTVPSIDGNRSKATSIKFDTPVSGGAYQDIRKVITEWNARPKHWDSPEFRGSMHQTRPSALFSPIFSRAREKIGPPEARQKRPRRNESLQARLLILCARFFLSKPQTKFAVWVFLCKFDTTSQSAFG